MFSAIVKPRAVFARRMTVATRPCGKMLARIACLRFDPNQHGGRFLRPKSPGQ